MIYYQHDQHFITVLGQTYPHRNIFKKLGARFVGDTKTWRLPFSEETLKNIDGYCREHGGGPQPENALEKTQSKSLFAESSDEKKEDGDSKGFKVSEILEILNASITRSFPQSLWVLGEVQNLNKRQGRGVFFNLSEEAHTKISGGTLSISATIWSDVYKRLEKKLGKESLDGLLQDGLMLRVLCQVRFYKGRASISLNVIDIDPQYTQGALALAREKLLKELRSKGLDTANKQKVLPTFPFRVGLISAENSRAASDFLHQLEQGAFCGEVLFCHAAMQGENSPPQLCAALETLVKKSCDIIVITRGGGSAADLRWFDTPQIAYAIAQSPIPVLAAIGHHDDRCVAEEICFQREKTPTAAAEFLLQCFEEAERRIDRCVLLMGQALEQAYHTLTEKQNTLKERLKSAVNENLQRKFEVLVRISHSLQSYSSEHLHLKEKKLLDLTQQLEWNSKLLLERYAQKVQNLEQSLQRQDPRPWLAKGWTQLWKGQNLVQSVEDVEEGEQLNTRLLDGILELSVNKKQKKDSSDEWK